MYQKVISYTVIVIQINLLQVSVADVSMRDFVVCEIRMRESLLDVVLSPVS